MHIVECVERSRPIESLKGEVGVHRHVHGEDKRWEINQESRVFGVRRDPKVLRRVSWILNKEGLHFANLFYIFE